MRGNTITSSAVGIEIGAGNSGTIDNNTISAKTTGLDIANAFTGSIAGQHRRQPDPSLPRSA